MIKCLKIFATEIIIKKMTDFENYKEKTHLANVPHTGTCVRRDTVPMNLNNSPSYQSPLDQAIEPWKRAERKRRIKRDVEEKGRKPEE